MEERKFTIELANGTVLNHCVQNGTNFVVPEPITRDTFKGGLTTVVFRDEGSGSETVKYNQILCYINGEEDGVHIEIRDKSQEERLEETIARLEYVAIMADIDIDTLM